jgi:hypothetical protein
MSSCLPSKINNSNQQKKQHISFKKRQVPKLTHKLHKLQPTISNGLGAIILTVSNRKIGQGKRQIWHGYNNSLLLSKKHLQVLDKVNVKQKIIYYKHANLIPNVESKRAFWVFKLKKQFTINCQQYKITPPLLAYERWIYDNLLYKELYLNQKVIIDHDKFLSPVNDPSILKNINQTIFNDLIRGNMSKINAKNVIEKLYINSVEASKDVYMYKCKLLNNNTNSNKATDNKNQNKKNNNKKKKKQNVLKQLPKVVVTKHRHTLDLTIEGLNKKHLLKLNHEHYRKLLCMWCITNINDDNARKKEELLTLFIDNNTSNNKNPPSTSTLLSEFHNDLYILLSRYYALQGHGFQAACPENVFKILNSSKLNVEYELFASPLNCFYGPHSYCSLFAEIDCKFGSLGSFWNFFPSKHGGSYQCNPPFVHNIMELMVDRLHSILVGDLWTPSSSTKQSIAASPTPPLSFTIIVPAWLEDTSYIKLLNSKFLKKHILISVKDHGFCDGAQHQRRDRYRASPYDTSVFILQNDAGQRKYNIENSLENNIRHAFSSGVPSEAMVERRAKAGRGFSDLDGAGGVYKGKKRNKIGETAHTRKTKEMRLK